MNVKKFQNFCFEWPFITVFFICFIPMSAFFMVAHYFSPLARLVAGVPMVWAVAKLLNSPFGCALHACGHAKLAPVKKNYGRRVVMWVVVAVAVAGIFIAVRSVLMIKIDGQRTYLDMLSTLVSDHAQQ